MLGMGWLGASGLPDLDILKQPSDDKKAGVDNFCVYFSNTHQ